MKKWKNIITKSLLFAGVGFAFIGAGSTVGLASGTVTWVGTADYQETLAILDDIKDEGKARITERDNANQTIVVRDGTISGLETELSTTQGELSSTKNTLTTTLSTLSNTQSELSKTKTNLQNTQSTLSTTQSNLSSTESKLQQAETDVNALKQKSAEVLRVLQNK